MTATLNRAGCRLLTIADEDVVGIWSDLDSAELRTAIAAVFGNEPVRVVYLDSGDAPPRYKVRAVAGEPVPLAVLEAMQQAPEKPWEARDRMLDEMGWKRGGRHGQA